MKAGGKRACPLSDEADMERARASCGTLCGVPRRQNRSVAGLVLAEVRSCPGSQFLFVGQAVGEPFSQPRMWRTLGLCGPSCTLADPHAALPCTQLSCLCGLSLSCGGPGSHLRRGWRPVPPA